MSNNENTVYKKYLKTPISVLDLEEPTESRQWQLFWNPSDILPVWKSPLNEKEQKEKEALELAKMYFG